MGRQLREEHKEEAVSALGSEGPEGARAARLKLGPQRKGQGMDP